MPNPGDFYLQGTPIPSGSDPVTDTPGTIPGGYANLNNGGWISGADAAARNALPEILRKSGMAFKQIDKAGSLFVLRDGPWAYTDDDWYEIQLGSPTGDNGSCALAVAPNTVPVDTEPTLGWAIAYAGAGTIGPVRESRGFGVTAIVDEAANQLRILLIDPIAETVTAIVSWAVAVAEQVVDLVVFEYDGTNVYGAVTTANDLFVFRYSLTTDPETGVVSTAAFSVATHVGTFAGTRLAVTDGSGTKYLWVTDPANPNLNVYTGPLYAAAVPVAINFIVSGLCYAPGYGLFVYDNAGQNGLYIVADTALTVAPTPATIPSGCVDLVFDGERLLAARVFGGARQVWSLDPSAGTIYYTQSVATNATSFRLSVTDLGYFIVPSDPPLADERTFLFYDRGGTKLGAILNASAPETALQGVGAVILASGHIVFTESYTNLGVPTVRVCTSRAPYFRRNDHAQVYAERLMLVAGSAFEGLLYRSATGIVQVQPKFTSTIINDNDYTFGSVDLVAMRNLTAAHVVTLPAPVANTIVEVKTDNTCSVVNTITIEGSGGEFIDGALTYVLSTQYAHVRLWTDGANWSVI